MQVLQKDGTDRMTFFVGHYYFKDKYYYTRILVTAVFPGYIECKAEELISTKDESFKRIDITPKKLFPLFHDLEPYDKNKLPLFTLYNGSLH